MTKILDRVRNGVDTEQMYGAIDGSHNRSTIQGFYGAGREDASRTPAVEIDVATP